MDSSSYLFKGLNVSQMEIVMATGSQVPMKKGQQIIREGQAANGVYITRKGQREAG